MSTVLTFLTWLLQMTLGLLRWVGEEIVSYAREHPVETFLALLALLRLFGTTVQTGWKGVLFVWGRARRELEPGFHPLLPLVHAVRQTPVRSITLHLPRQHVTTADGLVYEVEVNLVYHVAEPLRALVQIDDLRKGCETLLPLLVQGLLHGQTREALQDRRTLDEELAARADRALQRWGVRVEQAGFLTIAPSRKSLRLTQLALRVAERRRILEDYVTRGLSPAVAVALLGSDQRPVSRALRYRRRRLPSTVLLPPEPISPAEAEMAELLGEPPPRHEPRRVFAVRGFRRRPAPPVAPPPAPQGEGAAEKAAATPQ